MMVILVWVGLAEGRHKPYCWGLSIIPIANLIVAGYIQGQKGPSEGFRSSIYPRFMMNVPEPVQPEVCPVSVHVPAREF